jgi:uncharacterized membrane protein YphA (DoxX/SURF4 family)
MRQKATVQGRSFLFNLVFVLVNITGLTLVVVGSQKIFEDYFLLFNFIGYILIALSMTGIFIFQGRLMIANISRALVGSLFIVSGLVKANDPIGFSYKLEEYFEDGALAYRIKELIGLPSFSLEFLIEYALIFSVLICVLEIVLGVLVIIGGKIKLVSYTMVIMMFFFTFLTWHTANCDASKKYTDRDTYEMSNPMAQQKINAAKTNKTIKIYSKTATTVVVDELKQTQCVGDCGCFGDAMKGSIGRSLTPAESFWKDVVVLYFVFWIFIAQWIIEPNTRKQNLKFCISTFLIILGFSWLFSWYFLILFSIIAILGALWMLRVGGFFFGNYFGSSMFVAILTLIMTTFVLLYEPIKDYRPFAQGSNLLEKMNDGAEGKYENTFVLKNLKTGNEEVYSEKEYMGNQRLWEAKNYSFVARSQKEIIPTKLPTITDQFNPFLPISYLSKVEKSMEVVKEQIDNSKIETVRLKDLSTNKIIEISAKDYSEKAYPKEEYDFHQRLFLNDESFNEINLRDYIVKTDLIMIVSSRNLLKGNWDKIERYKSIYNWCKVEKIPFIIITNASKGQINYFRKKYNFNVPIFLNDETGIKTISRSNPSIMVIQKGIVIGKYPHRSTPKFEWLKKNILKSK